jgi:hypothetical protein
MRQTARRLTKPRERNAAAVYYILRPSVARAPPRPLNGVTLAGTTLQGCLGV